jgi:F-type H+-transporting ATPase subunit b
MTTRIPLESNFLVPNATFIVELFAFALVLYILARYVIPPVNKAMTDRQDNLRRQFEEGEEAKASAEAAEQELRAQIVEARHEAARIREEAREQGSAIIAEMRGEAQAEAGRIVEHAHAQMQAERRQVLAQLRSEVGGMAVSLAGKIVGESLSDDERQQRIVDRFIDEVESQDAAGAGTTGQAR